MLIYGDEHRLVKRAISKLSRFGFSQSGPRGASINAGVVAEIPEDTISWFGVGFKTLEALKDRVRQIAEDKKQECFSSFDGVFQKIFERAEVIIFPALVDFFFLVIGDVFLKQVNIGGAVFFG
jgi:hypothetical protein